MATEEDTQHAGDDDDDADADDADTVHERETEQEPEQKRRRLGRAARRRKQKMLDIQRAEDELRGDNKSSVTAVSVGVFDRTSVIPADRDHVWPAVLEQRKQNQWSETDEAALVSQLGYLPGNAIRVSARASDVSIPTLERQVADASIPIALQLYPIALRDEFAGGTAGGRKFKGRKRCQVSSVAEDEGHSTQRRNDKSSIEPYPTMFWLTSPLCAYGYRNSSWKGSVYRLKSDCKAVQRRWHAWKRRTHLMD
jgi:hypothetical protein